MNPYEPPQTITAPPEPPVVVQTHLEQVSFRDLAEIAWGYTLVSQIILAALSVALVLAAVTWQFYVPDNNPNWVIIVMLGCGSVLAVLICWVCINGNVASSTLNKHLDNPPERTKSERGQIWVGVMGFCYGTAIVFFIYRGTTFGVYLFFIPLGLLVLAIWPITKYQMRLLQFLRSFHPQIDWSLSGHGLRQICFAGVILTAGSLLMMVLDSSLGSIASGWLLLALTGLIVYVAPICYVYRELAREFDKLWP